MIGNKKVIAIVPARTGSKGLPGKNKKMLCGKPLIVWTLEMAMKSKLIDMVLVSTDDEEIAELARDCGATVPFLRPAYLATDEATSFDVVEHALSFTYRELELEFEYVVLLEPTSPLREEFDIEKMLIQLEDHKMDFDAIISLGEVREHPALMKTLNNGNIERFCTEYPVFNRRQENIPAYFPYGVAYITKIRTLLDEKTFYPKNTTYFIIERSQCYEIDDIYDFDMVESILKKKLEN